MAFIQFLRDFLRGKRADAHATGKEDREAELNALLDGMLDPAREMNEAWQPIIDDGMAYLHNDQLAEQERKEGWPPVQVNHLAPAARHEVSLLVQQRRVFRASPQSDALEDEAAAKFWGPQLQYRFDREIELSARLPQWLASSQVAGHWCVQYAWNPKGEWVEDERRWRGTIQATQIPPECVFVDPWCTRFKDADYIICRYQVPVSTVLAQWGKDKEKREAILEAAKEEASRRKDWKDGGRGGAAPAHTAQDIEPERDIYDPWRKQGRLRQFLVKVPDSIAAMPQAKGLESPEEGQPTVVTVEVFYFKDASETKIPAEMEPVPLAELAEQGQALQTDDGEYTNVDGMPFEDGQRPMREKTPETTMPIFPHGRYVVRVGETCVLNPELQDQVWKYKFRPVACGLKIPLPGTWHGENAVEPAREIQDWINDVWAHLGNYIRFFGDSQWWVERPGALYNDDGSQPLDKEISSAAGAVVELEEGALAAGRIKRADPPGLQGAIFNILQKFEENLRDLTGVQVTALGRQLDRATTATEAATLAAQTQIRTALQAFMLDLFLVESAYIVGDILQREFADGAIKVGDVLRVLNMGDLPGSEQMGQVYVDEQALKRITATPFDISIEATSAVPFDRQRQQEKWLALNKTIIESFGQPSLAAFKRLLGAFDVKNAQEILDEVAGAMQMQQAMAAEQAEAEQMAAQQGGKPTSQGGESSWQPGQVVKGSQRPTSPMEQQ